MLTQKALLEAANVLKKAGVETLRLDAEVLLAHALGLPREEMLMKIETVPEEAFSKFQDFIERRKAREPVARITGVQEFWSLPFKVNEETLIPRPDSETLVEAALKVIPADKPVNILDLGTGTGCLLLSILSERPLAHGVGVDASTAALECAKENSRALDLDYRAKFQKFNWMSGEDIEDGRGLVSSFDFVISNPPYIKRDDLKTLAPEVQNFDPKAALDGGPKGCLHYRILIPLTRALLRGRGWVFFEVGENQEALVRKILEETNFSPVETFKDLSGKPRVLGGFCPFGPL